MVFYLNNGAKIILLVSSTLLLVLAQVLFAQDQVQENGGFSAAPQAFQPLSPNNGWLLVEGHLYWTADAGNTWQDRSPAGSINQRIAAVNFINPNKGWLAAVGQSPSSLPTINTAHTNDGGLSWIWSTADIFDQSNAAFIPGQIYLQFLDDQHGWLVLGHQSSSNFNIGDLFSTSDGGESWTKRHAISGGPVHFISPQRGWMLGGPLDQEIQHTLNGGITWEELHIPDLDPDGRKQFFLPSFSTDGQGTLPVLLPSANGTELRTYHSADYGLSWQRESDHQFDLEYGQDLPLAVAQGQILVSIPTSNFNPNGRKGVPLNSQTVIAPNFQALALHSPEVGWGLRIVQNCVGKKDCTQDIRLLITKDKGLTWSEMSTPNPPSSSALDRTKRRTAEPPGKNLAVDLLGTLYFQGQGFDTCEVPTANQLQTWSSSSPYGAVNLYIGGSCRSCANEALSSELLLQAANQGWKFIPTWVGPQSSCFSSCGGARISNNQETAFQQGIQEADAALAAATRLGLAAADGSGTIIYYDLEAYSSTSTTCRNAAKSFISGWTKQIQEKGSKAGLYGATCGSFLSDFATIENVLDAIWPAYWTYSTYNSNASVWDLLCFSNSLWSDKQRIRQYAGGHSENWGGSAKRIDSNVIDGIVAAHQTSSTHTPTPTAAATMPVTATSTPAATATKPSVPTSTPTSAPSITPTSTPTCPTTIVNGSFEDDKAWTMTTTPYPAAYSTALVHSGSRSLRAGIINPQDNLYSYSNALQTITIPAGVHDQILHFWLYPQSTETTTLRVPENGLPLNEKNAANAGDLQMVLLLDSGGQILERLLVDRMNDLTWREFNFNLSQYAGQTIRLYFGVYNDGSGGVTSMYVDDVSLGPCSISTATPTPGPKPYRFYFPSFFWGKP